MVSDIEIQAREIIKMNARLNAIFAKATGQPIEKIAADHRAATTAVGRGRQTYGLVGRNHHQPERI